VSLLLQVFLTAYRLLLAAVGGIGIPPSHLYNSLFNIQSGNKTIKEPCHCCYKFFLPLTACRLLLTAYRSLL